jgi:hypothetical protein
MIYDVAIAGGGPVGLFLPANWNWRVAHSSRLWFERG